MHYLDTSAFLKLLVDESHSIALGLAVDRRELWSSTLLAVEAHRAALRLAVSSADVDAVLSEVSLVLPSEETFRSAQFIGRAELRTLDALHLATAIEIGPELESVITYDRRLAQAASGIGANVQSPGLPDGWWATN